MALEKTVGNISYEKFIELEFFGEAYNGDELYQDEIYIDVGAFDDMASGICKVLIDVERTLYASLDYVGEAYDIMDSSGLAFEYVENQPVGVHLWHSFIPIGFIGKRGLLVKLEFDPGDEEYAIVDMPIDFKRLNKKQIRNIEIFDKYSMKMRMIGKDVDVRCLTGKFYAFKNSDNLRMSKIACTGLGELFTHELQSGSVDASELEVILNLYKGRSVLVDNKIKIDKRLKYINVLIDDCELDIAHSDYVNFDSVRECTVVIDSAKLVNVANGGRNMVSESFVTVGEKVEEVYLGNCINLVKSYLNVKCPFKNLHTSGSSRSYKRQMGIIAASKEAIQDPDSCDQILEFKNTFNTLVLISDEVYEGLDIELRNWLDEKGIRKIGERGTW